MADAVLTVPSPPLSSYSYADLARKEFDSLPIPPLDPLLLSAPNPSSTGCTEPYISDLGLDLDENYDFDLTFDDLDDLYFPSETEPFLIPTHLDSTNATVPPPVQPTHPDVVDFSNYSGSQQGDVGNFSSEAAVDPNLGSPQSGRSVVSRDQGSDVDGYLNCSSEESGNCGEYDQRAKTAGALNAPSPLSSQGSGNCGLGVSETMNMPASPDSGNCVVDQKIKVEDMGKSNSLSKRKKESCEDTNGESRTNKYRRSENATSNLQSGGGLSASNEEEDKRKARLMRNRESAQLSRQRKKHYVEELEDKVRTMHSTIADLNSKISFIVAENASLRQQLGSAGMCPPPPPGMYPPMAPMAYPWMPVAPYVVKPQGSQVPLVPIPRLKPQQPVSALKTKKTENKKGDGKTKKVASVTFLGLLFFILLFGGLVPIVNVNYEGIRDSVSGGSGYVGDRLHDQNTGRVLRVSGNLNGSEQSTVTGFSNGKSNIGSRIDCNLCHPGSKYEFEQKERVSDEFANLKNTSVPLVASLFVPRNDKLVKIDGNLIIHSVMASERAMASNAAPEKKNNMETGLAIPRDLSPLAIREVGNNRGVHSHVYRSPGERQKALSSGSADAKEHLKSATVDGKLQQWFREGLAGPMLSSGMCTEVFQFDVSPTPGAIIPAPSVSNVSVEHHRNATHIKGKNRRILRGPPMPLPGSDLNVTGERVGRNSQKNFQGNKSVSSMVVSVLVDPREAGDSEVDGMITPKSLSRIFVVVLLDSVKYVTYSCGLPRSGLHLVTT